MEQKLTESQKAHKRDDQGKQNEPVKTDIEYGDINVKGEFIETDEFTKWYKRQNRNPILQSDILRVTEKLREGKGSGVRSSEGNGVFRIGGSGISKKEIRIYYGTAKEKHYILYGGFKNTPKI